MNMHMELDNHYRVIIDICLHTCLLTCFFLVNLTYIITHTHTHCPDLERRARSRSEDQGEDGVASFFPTGTDFWAGWTAIGWGLGRPAALQTALQICTTGVSLNKSWCVEMTCRCVPHSDPCPPCVWICDQCLTCNPLLNGPTIERCIDLVSPLAKGSRAWYTVCFVSAGRVLIPLLRLHLSTSCARTLSYCMPLPFHLLCYINLSSQWGMCKKKNLKQHIWSYHAQEIASFLFKAAQIAWSKAYAWELW